MTNAKSQTEIIAQLNDALRTNIWQTGKNRVMMTSGLTNFIGDIRNFRSHARRAAILRQIADYEFSQENDPHGEHDFGCFEIEEQKIFFKIDYYDNQLEAHTPDATSPALTIRVMTIMLAQEY